MNSELIIKNAFDPIADIYEELPFMITEDKKYWYQLCSLKSKDKPDFKVLELGCGTGRITLELAQKGFSITGIDLSESMLEQARQQLSQQPLEVQQRIKYLKADITNFSFNEKFDVILLPFFSLAVLVSFDDQLKCFKCVKKSLKPDGVFAFDLNELIQTEIKNSTEPEIFNIDNENFAFNSRLERDSNGVIFLSSSYLNKVSKSDSKLRNWKMRLIPTTHNSVKKLCRDSQMQIEKHIINKKESIIYVVSIKK